MVHSLSTTATNGPARRDVSDGPEVSVVVPVFNEVDNIVPLHDSLSYALQEMGRSYEILLVDDGSEDGTRDLLRELAADDPNVHAILLRRNYGQTTAMSAGFDNVRGSIVVTMDGDLQNDPADIPRLVAVLEQGFDYMLFLNNDTVVSQDFLDCLVESADERTMVAPKTYLHGQPGLLDDTVGEFDWRRGVWRGWLYGKPEPPGFERPREVSMASLCCLLVPAAVFRDVGLMDERFFMYYEDFDFVARAKAAGYRLRLNPAAVIHHRKAASSGGVESPFKVYYASRNRLYLMRKHSSRLRFALFLAYFLATRVGYFVSYLARGQGRQLKAMLMGIADFFRGRLGRTRELAHFR